MIWWVICENLFDFRNENFNYTSENNVDLDGLHILKTVIKNGFGKPWAKFFPNPSPNFCPNPYRYHVKATNIDSSASSSAVTGVKMLTYDVLKRGIFPQHSLENQVFF